MEWVTMLIDKYPFYVIFALAAILYELGFSRKLPILKKLVAYILLFIGCIPLTILKVLGLPIIPAMIFASVLLIFMRVRSRDSNFREEG